MEQDKRNVFIMPTCEKPKGDGFITNKTIRKDSILSFCSTKMQRDKNYPVMHGLIINMKEGVDIRWFFDTEHEADLNRRNLSHIQ